MNDTTQQLICMFFCWVSNHRGSKRTHAQLPDPEFPHQPISLCFAPFIHPPRLSTWRCARSSGSLYTTRSTIDLPRLSTWMSGTLQIDLFFADAIAIRGSGRYRTNARRTHRNLIEHLATPFLIFTFSYCISWQQQPPKYEDPDPTRHD